MTPYYSDQWLTVYAGDCREVLRTLPDESVHCVVTSPPYWGLRDYGTASWEGGDEGCDHQYQKGGRNPETAGKQLTNAGTLFSQYEKVCGKCGAVRIDNQLGLEPTPEQYVDNMVAVFREVRRVLRDDGTLWLNLGDSYAAQGGGGESRMKELHADPARLKGIHSAAGHGQRSGTKGVTYPGLKPKDLVGIPWRVAFALQADGWYLRSDIIWSKPNPMPESVTDRPTKAHEYVFLLAKSPRYYFDADAVRESGTTGAWGAMPPIGGIKQTNGNGNATYSGNQPPSDGNRNIRSVWTIPTQPYPGAHFAVFPPKLVEPCIKAGSSERGVCPECGAPWRRVVEDRPYPAELANAKKAHGGIGNNLGGQRHQDWLDANPKLTTGWEPSCHHDPLNVVPATVLDPFAGSGTVGMVAQSLSRRAVLIDLNPNYIDQQMTRNQAVPLGLA